jgi:hypothetical protein
MMDSLGRKKEAGEYYRKALSICLSSYGNTHIRTAGLLRVLGDHYRDSGEYPRALDMYQNAIYSLVPEYNTEEFGKNPDPRQVIDLLSYLRILKGKALLLRSLAESLSAGDEVNAYIIAAFSASRSAIEVIGILQAGYLRDEDRLYLAENEREVFEFCVETAYRCYELSSDQDYLEQAFIVAEKAKYSTLRTVLRREEALQLETIPDSLHHLESGMKKQLLVYQELLSEALEDTLPDQSAVQQYNREIFRLRDRIASLYRSLETDYPAYYELLYRQEVAGPPELVRILGRKERIIEYFMTGSELYTFALSRDEFSCSRDSIDMLFLDDLDLVQRYTSRVSVDDTVQDQHFAFIESASRLYTRLIPSSDGYSNLVIIPEGKLSYFPFDVLLSESIPEFSGLYKRLPFLIRDHTLRYEYSASLMNRPGRRIQKRSNRFVGFAPGYLPAGYGIVPAGKVREIRIDRPALNPLPGSIDEVTEIRDLMGGLAFTGETAGEGRFKSMAPESRIIHLATHAFIDDEDPLKSVLVFAEDPGADEDGLLNVYELYGLELNAGLAVLSACNTGSGKLLGGEGVMSLARAFFYAGVPSIIMTQWTVDDRKSYAVMLSFYKHLLKGRSAGSSLRRAKLEYLESALPGDQHPRYWAGYYLVGDPKGLFIPHRLLAIPAIIVFALLAVLLLRIRKRTREN